MQTISDTEWQGGFWADGGADSEVLVISITSTFTSSPGCKLGCPKCLLLHRLMELNSDSYSWGLACTFPSVLLIFSWAYLLTFSFPCRLVIFRSSLLSRPLIFCPVLVDSQHPANVAESHTKLIQSLIFILGNRELLLWLPFFYVRVVSMGDGWLS